jgi:hypothetical protein
MNERRLKLLTRDLITACGGLTEATSACRYDAPRLSRCQTVGSPDFLAIDVVATLEAYCGQPIISQALCDQSAGKPASADLLTEACQVNEAGGDLQRVVRLAAADGKITPREEDEIRRKADAVLRQVHDVLGVIDDQKRA